MGDSTRFGSSYFKTIRSYLPYLGYLAVVFFMIVNNGNILIDGTDERKNLQKKYNKL